MLKFWERENSCEPGEKLSHTLQVSQHHAAARCVYVCVRRGAGWKRVLSLAADKWGCGHIDQLLYNATSTGFRRYHSSSVGPATNRGRRRLTAIDPSDAAAAADPVAATAADAGAGYVLGRGEMPQSRARAERFHLASERRVPPLCP